MKNNKKYLLTGMISIAAAGIIIFAVQFRLRGSIKVIPGEDITCAGAVFYRQDDIRWAADFLGDSVSTGLLQKCLREERYPVVRVRRNGFGNFHYVLIIESSNGMFYCMDPLNQDDMPVPLSEFNNRVYAVRCVYPKYQ